MASIAVLVGNTEYISLPKLECCHDDLFAMKDILEATSKFSDIEIIENAEAGELKTKIRNLMDCNAIIDELFFYYTGHGSQHFSDFYYCCTNFDSRHPNETGLSNSELHTLLRLANANLVVKVVDACNSGTILVKSDEGFLSNQKDGFNNIIQISSCLESQNSLAGNPLSLFTDKFISSVLKKDEGIVYYTDIIYSLRDNFIENDSQTPFFVSQGTGRERFSDDARCFDLLREKMRAPVSGSEFAVAAGAEVAPVVPSFRAMLEGAELNAPSRERIDDLIGELFNKITINVKELDLNEFFEIVSYDNTFYIESLTQNFIISVLSREARPDNFVTTSTRKEKKNKYIPDSALRGLFAGLGEDYEDIYDLELNIPLKRAQLTVALMPKFTSLKKIMLIVSCAPSLDFCYIFEMVTQHKLKDFGKFDDKGDGLVRRWYKHRWADGVGHLAKKISFSLNDLVQAHLEATKERLSKNE